MASLIIAYILWFFGGMLGVHHFYLRRDRHAFAMWMSAGGYFGLGWVRDMWRLPEYVKDANDDQQYLEKLAKQMRKNPKPPNGVVRHATTIMIADILGYLVIGALPKELILDYHLIDVPLISVINALLAPIAVAIGLFVCFNPILLIKLS